jgi:hypothetical protein
VIVCGVLEGSLFYREYLCYEPFQWLAFCGGCALTIAGMMCLAYVKSGQEDGAADANAGAAEVGLGLPPAPLPPRPPPGVSPPKRSEP